MNSPLLAVENLTVAYPPYDRDRQIIREVGFHLDAGACLGVIGESGSGKSTVALAILNYLARGGRYLGGRVLFSQQDLLQLPPRQQRKIYGRRIAHVAQDPTSALNPSLRVGQQLMEPMAIHLDLGPAERRKRAIALLEEVRLRNAEAILDAYPHQLSGGMQQRVCIAMALTCDPDLLILDEPTTGLDAVTESAILRLLKDLKKSRNLAIILISHNLASVAGLADRLAIMYGGMVVETGPAAEIFAKPAHRYTRMLLDAVPSLRNPQDELVEIPWQEGKVPTSGCPFRERCDLVVPACAMEPPVVELSGDRISRCVRWEDASSRSKRSGGLKRKMLAPAPAQNVHPVLKVVDLSHDYRTSTSRRSGKKFRAVNDASLSLNESEILTVIGESGSGKSTLARSIVGLVHPSEGSIYIDNQDLARLKKYPRSIARKLQIVFQNIVGSLHPRKTIKTILARPYRLYEKRDPQIEELRDLMASVGLRSNLLGKRANALSGGEKQRSALGRAYAPKPSVLVLDEAFSALDASMKVRVSRLLLEKKNELRTSVILVTHDLPFVQYVSDRVLVMYRGWICDQGPADIMLRPPYHPYTETLVWSALDLEGEQPRNLNLSGDETAMREYSEGCPFASRCPRKLGPICETQFPPTRQWGDRRISCHIAVDELSKIQSAEFSHSG